MKSKYGKRIFSAFMAGIMALGMVSAPVYAANYLPDAGTPMYAGISEIRDDEYISVNVYCVEDSKHINSGYHLESNEDGGNPVTMILMNRSGTTHTEDSQNEPFPVYCLDKKKLYPPSSVREADGTPGIPSYDELKEIVSNIKGIGDIIAQHGDIVNLDLSENIFDEQFINHGQYQYDKSVVSVKINFKDGANAKVNLRFGFTQEFTTELFPNDIEHNKMLWVLEHSYPSISPDEVLKNVGSSFEALKSEVRQRYPSASDIEVEEKAVMAVYTTTQYALWHHAGEVVGEGTSGGHPVTLILGYELYTGYDATKALYKYLAMDREEYENYNNYNPSIDDAALAIQKGFVTPKENSSGDGFIYGPYTVVGQQDEKGIIVSGGDMTVSFKNTGVTSAQVQDVNGNPLNSLRLYQEFYINVIPANKNYYTLDFSVEAPNALCVEPGNRGRQYIPNTDPNVQTLGSGTTPTPRAVSAQSKDAVDTRPKEVLPPVTKTDADTHLPLPGATIGVYKEGEDTPILTFITDKNGEAPAGSVITESGNYYAKEITPPDGYTLNETKYPFTVDDDFNVTNDLTIPNEPENLKVGNLTVSKVVKGNSSKDDKFHFTVTLSDKSFNKTVDGVKFVNGVGTFILRHNESQTLSALPAGVTYTVKETEANTNGFITTSVNAAGTINADRSIEATFTNTKNVGTLTVRKKVLGSQGEKNRDFNFTVTLSDKSINGTYGDMTFTNGVAKFTLKHEAFKTATDLPVGIRYEVEEAENSKYGYTTTFTGQTGLITADNPSECIYNNKKGATGDEVITIAKEVRGGAGELDRDFHFTMTLDTPLNGTYGDMTFRNGVAKFTLKSGESATFPWSQLNHCYVSVHEDDEDQDGYITTTESDTIDHGDYVENYLKYINRRDGGKLVVKKIVAGNGGDTNKSFHFTVTFDDKSINKTMDGVRFVNGVGSFTLKHNESKTFLLEAGTRYTVVETDADQDGYITTSSNAEGRIVRDQSSEAVFTNTKKTGSVSVSKTVTGNAGDKARNFNFKVVLSDKTITGNYGGVQFVNGEASFTLKHGKSQFISGLPAGITYKVTEIEANQDGYITTCTGNSGTIESDNPKTVSFINSKSSGNIAISKRVEGNAGEKEKNFNFTLTLRDTALNGSYGDISFLNGVAKFTLHDGETKTATGLPVGIRYEITETEANADRYTTTSIGAIGVTEEGKTKEAIFTNAKRTGNISITKAVAGNAGEPTREFNFTLTLNNAAVAGSYGDLIFTDGIAKFTLRSGETKTASGIPIGCEYEVVETEANTDYYTTTAQNATGIVEEGKTKQVSFTNTKNTGSLSIFKTIAGNGANPEDVFHFTIELSDALTGQYGGITFTNGKAEVPLKGNESVTVQGIPVGISYIVTEHEANQNGYVTTSTGSAGTIQAGTTAEAQFTNTKMVGSLTVSNKVIGNAGDTNKDFHFEVALDSPNVNDEFGDMKFVDSVAEFTLKHDQSKVASDLPAGVSYTVKEQEENKDGYTTTKTGDVGTISADTPSVAEFVNGKSSGGFSVTKKVGGNQKDKEFEFTATLSDKGISGTYEDMQFTNGIAQFTLKHNETKTASGLPLGITYTVEETQAAGYTSESTNGTGEIQTEDIIEVVFTNTPIKRPIVLNKQDKETKVGIAEATLSVYSGTPDNLSLVFSGVTDNDGILKGEIPEADTYYLREEAAPEGYDLDSTLHSFTVDAYGNVSGTTVLYNSRSTKLVTLTKTNSVTGGPVAGAKIEVYEEGKDTPIAQEVTKADGTLSITVEYGKTYTFHEIETPAGYLTNNTTYTFSVDMSGLVTGTITFTNTPLIYDDDDPDVFEKRITIRKIDATNRVGLKNAKIVVVGQNKRKVIASGYTDESGKFRFTVENPGVYYYYEEAAPKGYETDNTKYRIEIDEYGRVKGDTVLKNYPHNPQTGVSADGLIYWIGFMAFVGGVIVTSIKIKHLKYRNQDQRPTGKL